jgi:phosphoglucosamine mutase
MAHVKLLLVKIPVFRAICWNPRWKPGWRLRGFLLLYRPDADAGIAYLTRAFRAEAGIVISASHNPFYDNGIKFFSIDGTKLPDEVEEAIEAEMEKELTCVDSAELGKASRIVDAAGRYIEFCKGTFPE